MSNITIRRSTDRDQAAIGTLAQLDSQERPQGDALLAFEDDELVAALPLDGSRAIADPFHHTAEIVDLLQLRAAQVELAGGGMTPFAAWYFVERRLPQRPAQAPLALMEEIRPGLWRWTAPHPGLEGGGELGPLVSCFAHASRRRPDPHRPARREGRLGRDRRAGRRRGRRC